MKWKGGWDLTNKPLSMEFIQKLVKKADENLPKLRPIFTEGEHVVIRQALKDNKKKIKLRDRTYNIRYFTWKKEEWVTVRPERGFVPMFSAPLKMALNPDKEF